MPYELEDEDVGDRFNDLTILLNATKPEGYDEYYNTRSPLLGREISLGYLKEKTDMMANLKMVWAILEDFAEGQIDVGWDFMTWYQNDIKTTPSIEGKLLDKITSREIKYTTNQTLHEHTSPQQPVKRGLLSRFRRPQQPQTGGQ